MLRKAVQKISFENSAAFLITISRKSPSISFWFSFSAAYNLKQVAGRFSCTISVFAENSCDCGWSLDVSPSPPSAFPYWFSPPFSLSLHQFFVFYSNELSVGIKRGQIQCRSWRLYNDIRIEISFAVPLSVSSKLFRQFFIYYITQSTWPNDRNSSGFWSNQLTLNQWWQSFELLLSCHFESINLSFYFHFDLINNFDCFFYSSLEKKSFDEHGGFRGSLCRQHGSIGV